MPLPSRHRIRNWNQGGLGPSSLLLGHGGSQYLIFTSEQRRNIYQRSLTFKAGSFPPPPHCTSPPSRPSKAEGHVAIFDVLMLSIVKLCLINWLTIQLCLLLNHMLHRQAATPWSGCPRYRGRCSALEHGRRGSKSRKDVDIKTSVIKVICRWLQAAKWHIKQTYQGFCTSRFKIIGKKLKLLVWNYHVYVILFCYNIAIEISGFRSSRTTKVWHG